jgi:hypothetical protein
MFSITGISSRAFSETASALSLWLRGINPEILWFKGVSRKLELMTLDKSKVVFKSISICFRIACLTFFFRNVLFGINLPSYLSKQA